MTLKSNLLTGLISGLVLAVLFYAFYSHTTKPRILLADDGVFEVSADLSPAFEALLPELVDFIYDEFKAMEDITQAEIESGVDELFDLVYAAVPTYVDAHYTLRGQYAELAAAALAQFSDESQTLFQKYLLEESGFNTRQEQFLGQLSDDSRQRLLNAFAKLEVKLEADLKLRSQDRSALREGIVLSIDDAQTRFGDTLIVRGATAAVFGAVALRVLGRKAVQKAAVRGAGKAGGGAVGGALTGATAGSVCGPASPACALGGAIVGWFAADYVLLQADKRFNRSKFEEEINQLVRREHSEMKRELITAYNQMYRQIRDVNRSGLQNRRIREHVS